MLKKDIQNNQTNFQDLLNTWQEKMVETIKTKYNEPKSHLHIEMERDLNKKIQEEQTSVANLENQITALSGYIDTIKDLDNERKQVETIRNETEVVKNKLTSREEILSQRQ